MTAEQIQQIKEKYKNPLYMQNAINNVADEYIIEKEVEDSEVEK